jgi:selenocysteine-specific elongation factor
MRHIIIGTAGHIDHGKSALVRAITGTDPDRLKEEKDRGITIDLGFAHWAAGDLTFSFVDVPGHERFVKNMLAGVGGFDAVVLVIAADESVMPQTREHFEICRLLHVPHGLIALTKADLADEEMRELALIEVRELTEGSFLAEAPIVAVSSKTGEGLEAFRAALVNLAARIPARGAGGLARLPIDRAFSVKGFGTVVTGTLVSGRIEADAELALLPTARRVKVRGVQVHGERETSAAAGQRVALNLGGIELDEVGRGDSLVTPETLEPTRMLDVRLEVVTSARPLKHGARVRFHQGTSETIGRVALAHVLADEAEGGPEAAPPPLLRAGAEVSPGGEAYARLRLEAPAVLSRGDRFILRAYSPPVTIGGGEVLDPHPLRGPIRTAGARTRFRRLDPAAAQIEAAAAHLPALDRAIETMTVERGRAGLAVTRLVARAGVQPAGVQAVVDRLAVAGIVSRAGSTLVAPAVLEQLSREVLRLLGDHHRAEPLSEGLAREELRGRAFGKAGDGVFERVIADLETGGKVTGRDRLALSSHRVALSGEEERARTAIEGALREAGLKPPDLAGLASGCGLSPAVVDRVTHLLLRQKTLVKLDTVLFHAQVLEQLKRDISALKGAAGAAPAKIDVATFKERYGVTRKFAIPLLEYLDRERITRRVGDARVLI